MLLWRRASGLRSARTNPSLHPVYRSSDSQDRTASDSSEYKGEEIWMASLSGRDILSPGRRGKLSGSPETSREGIEKVSDFSLLRAEKGGKCCRPTCEGKQRSMNTQRLVHSSIPYRGRNPWPSVAFSASHLSHSLSLLSSPSLSIFRPITRFETFHSYLSLSSLTTERAFSTYFRLIG